MRRTVVLALAALLAATRPAAAQDEPPIETGFTSGSGAGYLALTLTPVGALAQPHDFLLRRPGEGAAPLRLHGQFGYMDRGPGIAQRIVAAMVDLPVGVATMSLTAGYLDATCDDDATGGFDVEIECGGGITLGARLGSPIASRSLDAAGAQALVVGVEGTVGFSSIDVVELTVFDQSFDVEAQALSATVALPIALVVRSGSTIVSPSIRPAVGWGRSSVDFGGGDDEAESGVRAMLGATIAVRFSGQLGLDAGIQRVFFDEADTTFGLGISIAF
jgi:hypothetical protein